MKSYVWKFYLHPVDAGQDAQVVRIVAKNLSDALECFSCSSHTGTSGDELVGVACDGQCDVMLDEELVEQVKACT